MRVIAAVASLLLVASGAYAADPPPLARARALYNTSDFDGAIAAAMMAREQPGAADAAALVEARAHLERYRRSGDAADLSAAHDALSAVRSAMLSARDQVDFLVGLGQSLYLADLFGAAADLFDTALARAVLLPPRDRMMLLDWWATALDREAQAATAARRGRLAAEIAARMEEELHRDPGSAPANYWRAVAARGAGDLDAAWDAAVAAWVRAAFGPAPSELRSDIDRLVTEALIPERARARPAREQADVADLLRNQWNLIKEQWK